MAVKTILDSSSTAFAQMIKEFGAVTVMNAYIFDAQDFDFENLSAYGVYDSVKSKITNKGYLAKLDTLKMANITVEGPSKTVTGGQYSNPLIKFGKTARLEMQEALGRADALEAFGGVVNEYQGDLYGNIQAVHVTEDFTGPKLICGESYFIDRKTGKQVDVIIMLYQVLPDSIFNLSQDAEGDASVFDMNADLLTTTIQTYDKDGETKKHGVFYSILDKNHQNTADDVRSFADEAAVQAAWATLEAGQKIKVGDTEKTIATITESYDEDKKVVTYTVAYKE